MVSKEIEHLSKTYHFSTFMTHWSAVVVTLDFGFQQLEVFCIKIEALKQNLKIIIKNIRTFLKKMLCGSRNACCIILIHLQIHKASEIKDVELV